MRKLVGIIRNNLPHLEMLLNLYRVVLALAFAGPILAGAGAQADKPATLKPVILETVKAHDREVVAIAVSTHGKWVATAGVDRPEMTHTVKLWKTSKTPTHTLKGFDRPVRALDFAPDGSSLLVGGYDPEAKTGTVKIYDVVTGKLRKTLTVGNQPVERFALLDIGRSFVAVAGLNELKV
jgi:WD40 repeat protein